MRIDIRGANLNYEILGESGPWVTLSSGSRNGLTNALPVAERVAAAGYRVLVHDRRNCGASDVIIEGEESEWEIWADDLAELLARVGARPAVAGGSSSGAMLALALAVRHPEAVSGLLLWRLGGGRFSADFVGRELCGQYVEAARQGGMAAVCATEFFAERIEARPSNRERLMGMDPAHFIDVMGRWHDYWLAGADLPLFGATAEALASIRVPTCIMPGNDRVHPREVGEAASRLIPNAELHDLAGPNVDMDLAGGWSQRDREIAEILIPFLNRVSAAAPA
jgi:pimeloyl-ACP methyl ester carboxylesterase